jgi:hypothetical protein
MLAFCLSHQFAELSRQSQAVCLIAFSDCHSCAIQIIHDMDGLNHAVARLPSLFLHEASLQSQSPSYRH